VNRKENKKGRGMRRIKVNNPRFTLENDRQETSGYWGGGWSFGSASGRGNVAMPISQFWKRQEKPRMAWKPLRRGKGSESKRSEEKG